MIPMVHSHLAKFAWRLILSGAILMPLAVRADNVKPTKLKILVICTGNSARSQMTAGFLKSWDTRLDVYSAGTAPAPRINPYAVRAMKEVGVDISGGTPKNVRLFLGDSFDYVITVCDEADRDCPNFTGKVRKRVHMPFPDPAKATGTDDQIIAVFRTVRNDIQAKFTDYYEHELKKHL
jgi:arsenate reductase